VSAAPLVSVLIPSWNRLDLLREAIASVRAQTWHDLEIIIVDDGSEDGTWSWLEAQPGLRPLRRERRGGPAAARNLGAAAARGRYLAFLDSDDLWRADKLERQLPLLEADRALGLCHSDELWLRGGRELRQKPKHEKRGGRIFAHCLPMCRISPSASVLPRAVFEALGGFDEELEVAEDYELWLRLTCQYAVGFVKEPLTIKRGGHPGQLSERYGQIEPFRVEALRRVLERAPLDEEQRRLAREELARKCQIVAAGCRKRGRVEEAERYEALPFGSGLRAQGPGTGGTVR
jgi:glycosyltransferase involved in cell wall biosynthesis